jgi:hypothetical protein
MLATPHTSNSLCVLGICSARMRLGMCDSSSQSSFQTCFTAAIKSVSMLVPVLVV